MTSKAPPRFYSAARPDPGATPATAPPAAADPLDERGEERVPVSTGATLVANRQDVQPVSISDLSRHGCCLDGCGDAVRPGQFIMIRLAQLDPLDAIVRWVEGDRAGIEFTRALLPAVFEYHMRDLSPD